MHKGKKKILFFQEACLRVYVKSEVVVPKQNEALTLLSLLFGLWFRKK